MRYAEVILPLPLANSYTYRIPDELESLVTPGCRVMVYFGKRRCYTALVWEVHDRAPQAEQTVKELTEVGIECEPIRVDGYTGKKMTFFHDPDGLPLELHE